jgi:hypothetical protein
MILTGLKRSARVACVSEQTGKDLIRLAKINPNIVSVIYNGLNFPAPMEQPEAEERLSCLKISSNSPFLLHIGEISGTKPFGCSVDI